MADLKEVGVYRTIKLPASEAPQEVVNRQIVDAFKLLNVHLRDLNNRIKDLEEREQESFKYLRGNLSSDRTTPNEQGEITFKSGNNSVDISTKGNVVDLRVR